MTGLADMGESIIDGGKDIINSVGDSIDGAINGIKQMADSVLHPIDSLLGNWGTDLLEGSLQISNRATFDIPNVRAINDVTNVFIFVTTTFAICIVLFKVIEAQIQASNGSGEPLVSKIIEKLIYSSIALATLPWILNFVIKKIISPLGQYVISEMIEDLDKSILGERIRSFLISNFFSGGVPSIVLLIILAFFAYSIGMYFISICVFYADFLVLTMLTPLVAMSMLTDEQNYFQIWIKELISETLTMLVKLILYAVLVVNLLLEKYNIGNFMVMIGCGLALIKTPSALQNMWYSTKVNKGGGLTTGLMMMNNLRK
ncbi:conjugal transfer protein TrbL family protein [Vagococcus fluvialis]|uniref:conjugal transfer protein TrbL family protein n=1 Tax=Vagococcus fluvialis TaxID=2738 RepID=UPI0037A3C8A6